MVDEKTGDTNSQDQNESSDENTGNEEGANKSNDPGKIDVDALVATKVNEALEPLKGNLDKAYKARDEALKKIAEFEQKEKEANLARLKEEGKFKEAYELQLNEERAAKQALADKVVKLTRDNDVKDALTDYTFRSKKAAQMATHDITNELVQNADGEWVHRSGITIKDYIKVFFDNEENAFLLKQKASTGSGLNQISQGGSSGPKSLFDMSQDEVLKLAAAGKLPLPK